MKRENFSVYTLLNKAFPPDHALKALVPENPEEGWPARRNLKKALNHLALLRKKEKTATELGLHNINTPKRLFENNYLLLEKHQMGEIASSEIIKKLSGKKQNAAKIGKLLADYATVGHMEFHPSDACNLACRGCTYGHEKAETKPAPENFPFEKIGKIAALAPKSILVVGGGEPTLYKSGGHGFQDLVKALKQTVPNAKLALKTNGTHIPEGDWSDKFDWIRISFDAATEKTFEKARQKPLFKKVVDNFLNYLEFQVEYIGVSFLFSKSNIQDYAKFAEFIFNLVKEHKPEKLKKTGIEYRPLRRDPKDYDKPFELAVGELDIKNATKEIILLSKKSGEIANFLKYQTNITAILGGNTHFPHEFNRCYYSQISHIVRANGDVRPCFIRVTEPGFLLGNIVKDPPEKIALNTLYVGAKRKQHCNSHGCRQCHLNYILQEGLTGKIKPSRFAAVRKNPML